MQLFSSLCTQQVSRSFLCSRAEDRSEEFEARTSITDGRGRAPIGERRAAQMSGDPQPSRKYGAPLYCASWPAGEYLFVAGGGGKKSSGIKNRCA